MKKPVTITPDRVDAFIASGFNVTAVNVPELRHQFPNGMRPADAARLDKPTRLHWLILYRDHVKNAPNVLFTYEDVQRALDAEIARKE